MPLSLQKVVPSDLPTIIDVHFAAFQQSDPLHRIIYPLGPTPSVLACSLASAEKAFHEPQINYLKVVDSSHMSEEVHLPPAEYSHVQRENKGSEFGESGDRTVAFATWAVWREQREAKSWDVPYIIKEGDLGPAGEVNAEAANWFRGLQREFTRRIVRGRGCIYMTWLATRPSYQHRGAATMLLRWLIDLAEQDGLDLYLQATPTGYPLYRQLGFEDAAAFEVKLGDLRGTMEDGPEGPYRTVLMKFSVGGRT